VIHIKDFPKKLFFLRVLGLVAGTIKDFLPSPLSLDITSGNFEPQSRFPVD
jgi:hypothetical protein